MMIRRSASLLAAALLTGPSLACGLSSDLPPSAGSVQLGFVVAPGETTDHFDYDISGNGIAPRDGTIPVDDPSASLSTLIGGLPAGVGYHLKLSATSDDQGTFCDTDSVFDVVPSEKTTLAVALTCINADTIRTIEADGAGHVCPAVASMTIARAGSAVTLSASAFQFDDLTLSFSWEASGGTLATPNAAVSTYTCGLPGTNTLRFTVTDGVCPDARALTIDCP